MYSRTTATPCNNPSAPTLPPSVQTAAVAAFRCTGAACPDTCCRGWSMQLDETTLRRYETTAPELLDAVVLQEVPEGSVLPAAIMRRDPESDACVKYESGWCGIHAARGTDYLGDACHFYPRVVRRLGQGEDTTFTMTMTLSCPEAARLMLLGDAPLTWTEWSPERLPHTMRDYAPEGVTGEAALELHAAVQRFVAEAPSTTEALLVLLEAARSLQGFPPDQWPGALPMALKFAPARVPPAQPQENDPLNLALALAGLFSAAGKANHPRLRPIVERMGSLLAAEISWAPLGIMASGQSTDRLAQLPARMHKLGDWVGPFFRRWLAAQLNMAMFPFAGFGDTLPDRVAILGVRMATLALALLARDEVGGGDLSPQEAVIDAQALSRFLDHLAEPEFSVKIYGETGWLGTARLRGLLAGLGL